MEREAVEHFRDRDYDLILMDWQMPLMNGIEATARIRAMPGGLTMPIVGTTSGKAHAECLKGGMNDVVPKPFLFDKMRYVLSRWTDWTGTRRNPAPAKPDPHKPGLDCGGLPARLQLASASLSKHRSQWSAMSPLD